MLGFCISVGNMPLKRFSIGLSCINFLTPLTSPEMSNMIRFVKRDQKGARSKTCSSSIKARSNFHSAIKTPKARSTIFFMLPWSVQYECMIALAVFIPHYAAAAAVRDEVFAFCDDYYYITRLLIY